MSSIASTSGHRSCCPRCLRPSATCLCRWIRPFSSSVELLILQHPLEVHNAKGSARLLHLSVEGSHVVAGERFDQETLGALLYAGARTPVLLYPETPDHAALGMPAQPDLPMALLQTPSHLRLVVLDGTWRKSRKMLYVNPLLQGLPRLPLRAMPPSHYRIRKAHAPDQLSTLEASCYALAQIEGESDHTHRLIEGFDGFVETLALYQSPSARPRSGRRDT